jgi:RNA polymerase sigma factor (sigma-70 family)
METDKFIDDQELITKVKSDENSDALNVLISRHSGICYKIYNKYFYNNTSTIARDVEEQKDSLIYHAAKTFDPSCGTKFSTWLGNVITYACLNACNANKKYTNLNDDILNYLTDNHFTAQNDLIQKDKEILQYIEDIIDLSSDETAKEVIKMRYFSSGQKVKTFKQIADHFGVSTQTVVNWHDKFIDFLRNKLKSSTTMDIL